MANKSKKIKKIAVLLKNKPDEYKGLWLSVSKAKTFDDCKAKFRYGYIEKLSRKTWSFHVLGTFAHRVLELFHEARIKGDKSPDNSLMGRCFKQACAETSNVTLDQKKMVYEMSCEYLRLIAEKRDKNIAPKIIGVERNFYIDIDGVILLNGKIDVEQIDYDDVLHVADYKTSKSTRYLKKDFFQLLTYAFVKCVENPELDRVRCSYIMLRHGFEYITKEFDRAEIMEIQDKLLDYADKINSEKLYRPNPTKLCSWCDYVEICPEGRNFIGTELEFGDCSW